MAYTLVFKRSLSPVNQLTKVFDSTTASFSVVLKEKTDVFRPTFILQTDYVLWNFNYIDGSAFSGRQYFITDVRSIGNQRFEVDAKTDVLSTWADQIKANTAVIKRQENKYNLYLDDPDFHVYNKEKIQTLKFPNNDFMKSLQYVLVTNGAGGSSESEVRSNGDSVQRNEDAGLSES